MPTVIDTFVTEFALDPSKFTAGQQKLLESMAKTREQAQSFGAAMESHGKKVTELFTGMQRGALGLLATFFGGYEIERFINHITNLDASTGRLARTLGMSAADVSAWQGAIKQVGGTAESANASLAGLNQDMVRFTQTGQSQLATILRQPEFQGIKLFDEKHKLREALDVMTDISDRILKSGMDQRMMAGKLSFMPGMNQDAINLIVSGRLRRSLQEAREAGTPSAEDIKNAEEYQKQLSLVERSATGAGRVIFNTLAPSIISTTEKLKEFFKSLQEGRGLFGEQGFWDWLLNGPKGEENLIGTLSDKTLTWLKGARQMMHDEMEHDEAMAANPRATGRAHPPSAAAVPLIGPRAGRVSPEMSVMAQMISEQVGGVKQYTAFNDAYHALLGGGFDPHARGRALDFTLTDPSKSAATANKIRAMLAGMGINATVIDEYLHPSKHSTGGHIHVQINRGGAQRLAPVTPGAGAAARTSMNRGGDTINNSTSDVHVGVVINAPGADSDEVGSNVANEIKRRMLAAQANTGF